MWFGVTIQSCSGACVWLINVLVISSCTGLPLCISHPFSNFIQLVPLLFTPVQLCTFSNLWENFLFNPVTLLFFIVPGLILHYIIVYSYILNAVCLLHTWYDGFCETIIYIKQQPQDLSQKTVQSDAATEQNYVRSRPQWRTTLVYASLSLKNCSKELNTCLYHSHLPVPWSRLD